MAYPLHFPEKEPKGTKQGAKSPGISKRGREIGVFLAFSRFPASITRIEQDLRRRTLYPAELRVHYLTGAIVALQTKVVKSKNSGSTNISSYENTGKFHKQMQYF